MWACLSLSAFEWAFSPVLKQPLAVEYLSALLTGYEKGSQLAFLLESL